VVLRPKGGKFIIIKATVLTRLRATHTLLLWAVGLATVAMMAVFQCALDLRTTAAPLGIVSLELAGNEEIAQEIIASWDVLEIGLERAHASLRFDTYAFIPAYTLFLALACLKAWDMLGNSTVRRVYDGAKDGNGATRLERIVSKATWLAAKFIWWVGLLIALAQVGTALLDWHENSILEKMLAGTTSEVAALSALPKLLLILLALLYACAGLGVWIARKVQPKPLGPQRSA